MKLVDASNSVGGKVYNQGVTATVTPHCTLSTVVTAGP